MLWIKVGFVAFIMSIAAWFTSEFRERDARIAYEAAQKATHAARAAQVEQALIFSQEQAEESQEHARKAIEALEEREAAQKTLVNEVNTLMAEIQVLNDEIEELRVWGARYHPPAVVGLLNAARTGGSARAYSGDETDLPPPSAQPGAGLPDRGVPGGD